MLSSPDTRVITVKLKGKLKRLAIHDHKIPLGCSGLTPQDTVNAMLRAFNMTKQRCYNKECKDYEFYGGRGITIDSRWLEDPINMLIDMGLRPDGYTLERIDNDGPYSADNCRWATRQDQMQNTRSVSVIEFQGERHCISEWERLKGFKPGTLKARLNRLGYTVEEAMTKEVKCGGLLPGKDYEHLKDRSWRNTSKLHPRKPKFNLEDVVRIRAEVFLGESRSSVARRWGTSTTTVSNIVDRLGAYKND